MSPEQAAADNSRPVGPRSDLFSLGIVLYEMITSQRLFPGGSSPENHARVITFRGPSPEELALIPGPLRGIVSTALQGDPDQRFQTAQEVEAALTEALGVDVLLAGRQYLQALLPRLFPEEHGAEMAEEGVAALKTNAQITLADVDALPPKRERDRPSLGTDGGVVPSAVVGGDTVISPKEYRAPEPEEDPEDPEHTRLPSENPEDPEHTRLPAESERAEPSGLTLAPPIAVRERTRTNADDEPLYPPRPASPAWLPFAFIAGGVLVGIPAAILLGTLVFHVTAEDPVAIVSLTPMPMTPRVVVSESPQSTPARTPFAEETPVEIPAVTPVPMRTRPVRTPIVVPLTPDATPTTGFVSSNGVVMVDAQPPCEVFLDHSRVAVTTPFERELKAGKHTFGFVHKATGLWLEQTYEVPAGGTLTLFVDVPEATVRVR